MLAWIKRMTPLDLQCMHRREQQYDGSGPGADDGVDDANFSNASRSQDKYSHLIAKQKRARVSKYDEDELVGRGIPRYDGSA